MSSFDAAKIAENIKEIMYKGPIKAIDYCFARRLDANDKYLKLGQLLQPTVFSQICKLMTQFKDTNDQQYIDQAIAIIMGLGFSEEQAHTLLRSIFKDIYTGGPGFTW